MDPRMPPMDPGQFVDVVVEAPEEGKEEIVWLSKVKSAHDDTLVISLPQKNGESMPHPGLPFSINCRIPKDAHVWSFDTEVTEIVGDSYFVKLPSPDEVKREQRRNHVRAAVQLRVEAAFRIGQRYFAESKIDIVDLSGGGCQLTATRPFIPNAIMRLKVPLLQKVIEVHGKVVRANPFPRGESEKIYTSGFAFTDISEADRELMIKFIFEKMREDLKQGKLG